MSDDPSTDEPGHDAPPAEQSQAKWAVAEWLDKVIVDRDGERIGKLQDVSPYRDGMSS